MARETKTVYELCCVKNVHSGSTPGAWGGPVWAVLLISWVQVLLPTQGPLGSEALSLFPSRPTDWNPSGAPTS